MFRAVPVVLEADLVTSGTLVLPGVFDKLRTPRSGQHVAVAGADYYKADTDFTIVLNGNGQATITWLHADTISEGDSILFGIAQVDSIIAGQLGGGSGGGGDATAANQNTTNTRLGALDDTSYEGSGSASIRGVLGGIYDRLAEAVPELPKTPALAATDMDATIHIDSTATGSREVVAAVPGEACRVHAWEFQVDGACDVTVKSGATVIYGPKFFGTAGGGGSFEFRERPYFKTAANEALTIETSASVRLTATFETKTEA